MITVTVNEEGTLKVVITFTDENDTEHDISSLTSVNWQLSDHCGTVIGTRTFANGLITANPVILSGDDLALSNTKKRRVFAVRIVYTSSSGAGLTANEELEFRINDLINTP
jgi:hypothetical protein